MAKKRAKRRTSRRFVSQVRQSGNSMAFAVLALVLNILVMPGLGSIIGGKSKEGVWQIVITVLGLFLVFSIPITVFIGLPLFLVAWMWGIVTGVRLVKEAR